MAECNDKKCPIHGEISVRGSVFTGTVISTKPEKTAIVERILVRYVPKYERYTKSKSRIYSHCPDCLGVKENDVVKIGETRKLSKTKSFVVLEIIGKETKVTVEEDTFRDHKRKKKEEEPEEKKEEKKTKEKVEEEPEEEIKEEEKETEEEKEDTAPEKAEEKE